MREQAAARHLEVVEPPRVEQRWLTMADAAVYLGSTVGALQKAVERGLLKPDSPARRGWSKQHRFLRETLDAYARGGCAAR